MSKLRKLLKPLSNQNPKPDPKELSFCCPKCGSSELSLIQTGVRVIMDVDCVYEDGRVTLGEPIHDEVYDMFYECAWCEYGLSNDSGNIIRDNHDLVKWFQENCKLGTQ